MYEIYVEILKKKGLKSVDVSKGTGIAQSTLSDWKHGSKPSLEKLIKIAKFLDVSLDYLLTGKDAPAFVMPDYDKREQDLIEKFGSLTNEQKDLVVSLVNQYFYDNAEIQALNGKLLYYEDEYNYRQKLYEYDKEIDEANRDLEAGWLDEIREIDKNDKGGK